MNPKDITILANPIEIVNTLLELLTEKERNIIINRFGLNGTQILTLAAIGEKLNVTRERIRQVQNYTIKKLQRNAKNTKLIDLHDWLNKLINSKGGIISDINLEDKLLKKYPDLSENLAELKLACVLNDEIVQEYNRVDFVPHYRLVNIPFSLIKTIDLETAKILKTNNHALEIEGLANKIQDTLPLETMKLSKNTISNAWLIDRRLKINDNKISMKAWRHVNPRTLFDKILFVLNEENEAHHYSEIAKLIQKKNFDSKEISTQAVHNELINNNNFVLIGRGIYALKTWGYKEGTVADVLESILAKEAPMHLEDLTQAVLQRRKVKAITIQINLNSKKHKFKKNQRGLYELV